MVSDSGILMVSYILVGDCLYQAGCKLGFNTYHSMKHILFIAYCLLSKYRQQAMPLKGKVKNLHIENPLPKINVRYALKPLSRVTHT